MNRLKDDIHIGPEVTWDEGLVTIGEREVHTKWAQRALMFLVIQPTNCLKNLFIHKFVLWFPCPVSDIPNHQMSLRQILFER